MKAFQRVRVGASGARFALSPACAAIDHDEGGDADTTVLHSDHCRCERAFALRGAPPGAGVVVSPFAVVWVRASSRDASMLVGQRAGTHGAHATVAYVTHTVADDGGWRLAVTTNVEPPWRPRHARQFAYALPRNTSHTLRSLHAADADAGDPAARLAARAARERARMPADVRHVADFIAFELYNNDDSVCERV